MDRTAFISLVGKISEVDERTHTCLDEEEIAVEQETIALKKKLCTIPFSDVEIIQPLGAGGFGLVKLVRVKGITNKAFALKCIQKIRVVQYGQQRHIMDERNILMEMESPFILRLYQTFKSKSSCL